MAAPQRPALEDSDARTTQQSETAAAAPKDCLQCRVVGTGVCLSASAYLALQLARLPAPVGVHRAALVVFAAGFATLGVARALT